MIIGGQLMMINGQPSSSLILFGLARVFPLSSGAALCVADGLGYHLAQLRFRLRRLAFSGWLKFWHRRYVGIRLGF